MTQNIEGENEIDVFFSVDLLHASPPLVMLESDDKESICIGRRVTNSRQSITFRQACFLQRTIEPFVYIHRPAVSRRCEPKDGIR